MKSCLNPKLLGAIAVAAVGAYVLAPNAFVTALPFLLLALCPLMMGLMMWMMRSGGDSQAAAKEQTPTADPGSEQKPTVNRRGEPVAQETQPGTQQSLITEANRLRAQLADVEAKLASLDSAPVPTEGGEAAPPPRRSPRGEAQPARDRDAASPKR